jgi:LAS superfamily LD-carboxypeptidase LdcB
MQHKQHMAPLTLIAMLLAAFSLQCTDRMETPQNLGAPPAEQQREVPPAAFKDTLSEADRRYLLGKFDQSIHPDFTVVGKPYTDRPSMYLRKEAFEAFQKMHEAAKKDGITLKILSSTRNFNQQKAIWEGKWAKNTGAFPDPGSRARKILEYSSMPGSSRHHWGTDIDLNDLNNEAFMPGGVHERVYDWLLQHAGDFGFCQPYSQIDDRRPTGYFEERWHWSYTPLSSTLLRKAREHLKDTDFSGFKGAETALQIGIVRHYILGVHPSCF